MNIWKIKIYYKLTGTIKHLSVHLSRKTHLTIYEFFVRPRLDYGDIVCGYGYIIYDNPVSESLIKKTGEGSISSIPGNYRFPSRHGLIPKYLFDITPVSNDSCYNTRDQSKSELTQFYTSTKSFNSIFFPFCFKEWNKLDAKIRNLPSVSRFK